MHRLLVAVFALSLFFGSASTARAEVDIPWQWIHDQLLASAAAEVKALVGPYSAEVGFPKQLPTHLQGKSWEVVHGAVTDASVQASQVLNRLLADAKKYALPLRVQLGLRYFALRLSLGGKHQSHLTGNEKAYRFLCHTFATACRKGLDELKLFVYPEPILSTDMLYVPKVREGLLRAKSLLPVVPSGVAPEQAEAAWRDMARLVLKAGNDVGMTARMVGYWDFPAWKLRFAVKYFQTAARAAVDSEWEKSGGDSVFWQKACEKLGERVTQLSAEIDEFLATLK